MSKDILRKIDEFVWVLPKHGKMRANCLLFLNDNFMRNILEEETLQQIENVASLPGVVDPVIGMPDIHWGYGFPIGTVAATDVDKDGVISPGGVGFDINCGVRLIASNLSLKEFKAKKDKLVSTIFSLIPTGVGVKSSMVLTKKQLEKVVLEGAQWVVRQGWGLEEDLSFCEEAGCMFDADPSAISPRAYERGRIQLGTLGSGNHFLEFQLVEKVFDTKLSECLGLFEGQIVIMLHSGSRGLGHQVCSDAVKNMLVAMRQYGISVLDKQLASVPFYSKEGQLYWKAMCGAANYAWANRQLMTYLIREGFERVFNVSWKRLGLNLIYDVAHNIAKLERQKVGNKYRTLCVHRKGATRAMSCGAVDLPQPYSSIGQPVILPGDMGRNSFLLIAKEGAKQRAFSSCCHGAGRLKSRRAAKREIDYVNLMKKLTDKDIIVFSHSRKTLVEEAPLVYKDVGEVVDIIKKVGLAEIVVRMRPVAVIKG